MIDTHGKMKIIPSAHLPALQEETAVDGTQPHDGVARLEVAQAIALGVQVHPETFEQLRC